MNKSTKNKSNSGGLWLFLLQSILSALFVILTAVLDILPGKILFLIILLLLLLDAGTFFSQRNKSTRKVGKAFSILVLIPLLIGCVYLGKTWTALNRMTSPNEPESNSHRISVIVLAEDPAKSLEDAKEYRFGIQQTTDRSNTDRVVELIRQDVSVVLNTVEFGSLSAQKQALFERQIGAMIINEAYRELIEESHVDFESRTMVLKTFDLDNGPSDSGNNSDGAEKITEDPFVVFLSGIDTYGQVSLKSRSDVNILAAVNPKTKQILLLTTPRDYYVELARHEGAMDKLTHAGLYGVDVSMETLETLYGITVDDYVRVNFSGFEKIIDALGGVDVYSAKAFSAGGYAFKEGLNHMDGAKALTFVRKRHSFADGDIQRGKNQMALIEAVINKAMSPAILTRYLSLLDSVAESFTTSLSVNEITELVKMQLEDGASWNIVSYNVSGTGSSQPTYSFGKELLYVMIPDQATVEQAKNLLEQVRTGETLISPQGNK